MATTYSKIEVESLCRIAALRGFARGVNWARCNPSDCVYFTMSDLTNCENAIISEMRAEGKIPHWE